MNTHNHTKKGLCMGCLVVMTFTLHAAIHSFAPQMRVHPQATATQMVGKSIILPTDISMAYVEKGEPTNTTVLFLYGITDSRHSFEPFLNLFPKDFHFVVVMLPGQGESAKQNEACVHMNFVIYWENPKAVFEALLDFLQTLL